MPHPLEEKFDTSPMKLNQVEDFVQRVRAKISLSVSGLSFKLYEICLRVVWFL